MRLGLGLPQTGLVGTRENVIDFNVIDLARQAEQLGYDSLWVFQRLLYPLQPEQTYGAAPRWPETYKYMLDPLDTLAFVAAVTSNIRLGTSVLDFPYYSPAHLAKRIATLNVLSNGRTVIGAGIGWSEDEYLASGVPFARRGARMAEVIQALYALWGADPVEFHGTFFDVPATVFRPKPVQQPRPMIVLGGYAPSALARAAALADGFNPVATPDAASNEQWLGTLRSIWHESGREGTPEIIVRVNHGHISAHPLEDDRSFLTGSIEQVRSDLKQLAGWGATEVFFDFSGQFSMQPDGYPEMVGQMAMLREAAILSHDTHGEPVGALR